MRRTPRIFLQVLSIASFTASMVFFYQCIRFLSRRDYVAALLLMVVGMAVIHVASELARMTLAERE